MTTDTATTTPTATTPPAEASPGATPPAEPAATTPPANTPPADPVTPAAGTPPAGNPGDEPPAAEPSDDWRSAIAGDDEKLLSKLKRLNSPKEFGEMFRHTEKKARDDSRVLIPGENATEEQLAEFRQQRGIPESHENYEITATAPEGLELGEADKAMLGEITKELHGIGGLTADPTVVNTAHKLYYNILERREAQGLAAHQELSQETTRRLKAEMGAEFKPTMEMASEAVKEFFGVEDSREIWDMQLADGTLLGDHENIIRGFMKIARGYNDDTFQLRTSGLDGMSLQQVQEQYNSLMALRTGSAEDRNEYERRRQAGETERLRGAIDRLKQASAA